MREIKFRGKRVDNGEWVKGNYIHNKVTEKHYIFYSSHKGYGKCEVIPETVGQYIERKDKNGVEMYEGDKLNCSRFDSPPEIYQVIVKDIKYLPQQMFGSSLNWIEVIGNIHEPQAEE